MPLRVDTQICPYKIQYRGENLCVRSANIDNNHQDYINDTHQKV